jgi:CheY-like chemotaxis protein
MTDMSMPVMDGMTATRAIREHEQNNNMPRSCIIALTGLASSSARLEAWSSGIDHYITKPVKYRELRELLQSEKSKRDRDRKDTETHKTTSGVATEGGS